MTDYVLPVGWKFYDSKSNQTIFTGPGHTVGEPHLMIFDRVVPQNNGQSITHPKFRVRVIRGHIVNDEIVTTRSVVDMTVRWASVVTPATVMGMLEMLGIVLSDPDFRQDVVEEQLLPRAVSSV